MNYTDAVKRVRKASLELADLLQVLGPKHLETADLLKAEAEMHLAMRNLQKFM